MRARRFSRRLPLAEGSVGDRPRELRRHESAVNIMATFEDLKRRYPGYTDEQIQQAVDLLNQPPASRERIWEGEDFGAGVDLPRGEDGLTAPQRDLNRFAADHGLPIPFASR